MMRVVIPKKASFLKTLLCLCGICVFLAGLSLCFPSQRNMTILFFSFTSFYLIGGLLLLWTTTLLIDIPNLRSASYLNLSSLLLTGTALAIATTIFITCPPSLRLHTDEVCLLGTSRSFYADQTVAIPREAALSNGKMTILRTSLPTRPLLFPFLTNLIHRGIGFDLKNVFILNFIGLSVLLLFIGAFITHRWGLAAGIATQFAIASHPILWHTASSGITDLFNALFFCISILSFKHYLQTPSPRSLMLLILSLCLMGNIRYESMIFLPITIATLIFFRKIPWEHVKSALPMLIITAICCLPAFWQRSLFIKMKVFNDPTILNFSLKYFFENALSFGATLLSFQPATLYYLTPFLTLGTIILIISGIKIIRNNSKHLLSIENISFLWLAICLISHGVLICFFAGGIIKNYVSARYFLIEAVFLSIFSIIFIFSRTSRLFLHLFLSTILLLIFILQLQIAPQLREAEIKACYLTKYFQVIPGLIGNLPIEKSLLVINYPIEYILRGWPSIYLKTLYADTPLIKKSLNTHEYQAIYYIKKSKDKPKDLELRKGWAAKLIRTSMINKHSFVSLYTLEPKE